MAPTIDLKKLAAEGWVTDPEALQTIVRLGELRLGDLIYERNKHTSKIHHRAALIMELHIDDGLANVFTKGHPDESQYWELVAWKRPA